MTLKKNNPYDIPFPVLYDTKIYASSVIRKWLRLKRTETLMNSKKGYYNYETDKFEIPKKDFIIIEKNPKLKFDLEIIKEVGFKII